MLFPIITFITAITIAAIAAWFSVAGLMAIFTASALSVAIMAVALEVGKLVSASWVYRNWKRGTVSFKVLSYNCSNCIDVYHVNGYFWFSIESTFRTSR